MRNCTEPHRTEPKVRVWAKPRVIPDPKGWKEPHRGAALWLFDGGGSRHWLCVSDCTGCCTHVWEDLIPISKPSCPKQVSQIWGSLLPALNGGSKIHTKNKECTSLPALETCFIPSFLWQWMDREFCWDQFRALGSCRDPPSRDAYLYSQTWAGQSKLISKIVLFGLFPCLPFPLSKVTQQFCLCREWLMPVW